MSRHLGIDLGGTNIKTAVVEEALDAVTVSTTVTRPTGATDGPDAVSRRLVEAGLAAGPCESVGLGVPGLFGVEDGKVVLFPNLPGPWPGYPLRDRVEQGLGLPITLINDARAFTLAESRLGAGRGCRVIVAVVLGTGVGGGLTIDGELHLGAFGVAGEIGHQTVQPDGPVCGCGNRGCLEVLTKADALAGLAGCSSAEEVYEAAERGDARALRAIDTVAGHLGVALANVVTLLGPDRVIIGGGVAMAGDLLLGPIRAAVRERVTLVPTDRVEVVFAELGPYAGAIGAALAGQSAVRAR